MKALTSLDTVTKNQHKQTNYIIKYQQLANIYWIYDTLGAMLNSFADTDSLNFCKNPIKDHYHLQNTDLGTEAQRS